MNFFKEEIEDFLKQKERIVTLERQLESLKKQITTYCTKCIECDYYKLNQTIHKCNLCKFNVCSSCMYEDSITRVPLCPECTAKCDVCHEPLERDENDQLDGSVSYICGYCNGGIPDTLNIRRDTFTKIVHCILDFLIILFVSIFLTICTICAISLVQEALKYFS